MSTQDTHLDHVREANTVKADYFEVIMEMFAYRVWV